MNRARRQFIRGCATIVAGSAVSRRVDRASVKAMTQDALTNWAGNLRYSTDNVHPLTSIEEIREFVKEHDALKVLGTRHCFNGIADSTS